MFSRKIEVISSRIKKLDKINKFSSYINKKVYSKSGELLGDVADVMMKEDCMVGVMIRGRRLFIGKEFFKSYINDAIMLKIEPVTNLIGKQIFDSKGKRVGKIVEVMRKGTGNSYYELRVKKNIYTRSIYIPKKAIAIAKKTVILKKPWVGKKK